MNFRNQKAAREALSEVLAALLDREWLAKFAVNEFFGPGSIVNSFSQQESIRFVELVTQAYKQTKGIGDTESKEANKVDPHKVLYFFQSRGADEDPADFDHFWEGIIGLEEALDAKNRYQYFVGNLKKEKEDLEAEFKLVESILTPEWLWIYLVHITGEGGSCSTAGIPGGAELIQKMDSKFWKRCHTGQDIIENQGGEPELLSEDAADITAQLEDIGYRQIDQHGIRYSLAEAAEMLQTTPKLLRSLASRYRIKDPFTKEEIEKLEQLGFAGINKQEDSMTTGYPTQEPLSVKGAHDGYLSNSEPENTFEASKIIDIKPDKETKPAKSASAAQSPKQQPRPNESERYNKWGLLKKFAAGAAVIAGAALISAIASSIAEQAEEEEEEEDAITTVPFNYAGRMMDGTPTFWGPKGGRYYRSHSGRKVYI